MLLYYAGNKVFFVQAWKFKSITTKVTNEQTQNSSPSLAYMTLLKRIAYSPKIMIADVDGTVLAGGVGIVAASDIAIASPRSQFTLSEALWSLPANLMPYLIRRVGFQKAYLMTLTTQTLTATEAHHINLIDEMTEQSEETIRKYLLRLARLDEKTIIDLKNYFRKLGGLDERIEKIAMDEFDRLIKEPRVIK